MGEKVVAGNWIRRGHAVLLVMLISACVGRFPAQPELPGEPLTGVVNGEVNSGDDINWIAEVSLDTPLQPGGIQEVVLRFSRFEPCGGWTPMSNPINTHDRFVARAVSAEWLERTDADHPILYVTVDDLVVECE